MIGDRLSAVLLVLVTGLGALAAWQWRAAVQPAPDVATVVHDAPLVQPSAPTPFIVLSLAELSQTVERPLFNSKRRPPEVEVVAKAPSKAAEKVAALTPLAIELSAVILEADRQFALFRKAAQASLLRAEVGQSVDGWVVSEIRGDGVSLERGSEKQTLVLRTFKAPIRKKPARRKRAPVRKKASGPRAAGRRAPMQQPQQPQQEVEGAADPPALPTARVRRPRRPLRGPRRRSIQRQQQPPATPNQ